MILLLLSIFSVVCAAIPALMFLGNLKLFCVRESLESAWEPTSPPPNVSLLIPARDEATGIAGAIDSALRSRGVEIEIVVLDDHSTDETASIVNQLAANDPRIRLIQGKPLPAGWNGKQHACFQLASAAKYSRLAFLDADVRLQPEAMAKMIRYQDERKVALLSAFPQQLTGTWSEKWLIPLMHFILLGFLPMHRMRRSDHPAYAAGCGQFFLTTRADYDKAGTHAAIRGSRHDGVKLPRAYRANSLSTDVIDGTSLAQCRMYRSVSEVTRGLLKNAIEGIANPRLILPFTVILLGGTVAPWLIGLMAWKSEQFVALYVSIVAVFLSILPRALAAYHFRQSLQGALFHPLAILWFVSLQWQALILHISGRKIAWRGRE